MNDRPRVLVVDDQADICELIREVLEAEGCTVSTAANGRNALKLLQSEPFDVAVIDALLPHGVSGRRVAEEATSAGVPIIMITGSLTMREDLEGSPYTVLMKPFRMSQLTSEIRRVIGERP
jgi:DNA-binding response OmpR family regulator